MVNSEPLGVILLLAEGDWSGACAPEGGQRGGASLGGRRAQGSLGAGWGGALQP